MKRVDKVLVREKVDMNQWEVSTYAISELNILTEKKVDQVPVREISRHEATRSFCIYAVSERFFFAVKQVDQVPVREKSKHEAMRSSCICCIITQYSHREKSRQGTSA